MLDLLAGQPLPLTAALLFAFLAMDGLLLVGLVVPADALILLAGTTASGPVEIAVLVGAGTAGVISGASAGHLLGSRYGPRIRAGRAGRRVGQARWTQAEGILASAGPSLALSYFLPVMDSVIPVLAGTFGVPFRRFTGWVTVGALAWVGAYAITGSVAAGLGRTSLPLLVSAVAALLAGAFLVRRARSLS
ncbi:VTT domain-containing protein [Streptosporangiaceae bacterium NEAU-GS5]|nr:VTT domain-containing protein [Streptosporangiaceae bacterium NEAU-GS5]